MDLEQHLINKIVEKLGDAQVELFSNDGVHYQAVVVSSAFEGKSRLAQHRMVMNALQDEFDNNLLHALQLTTKIK